MTISEGAAPYAARLEIDYPERLDRLTSVFRLIWLIPIFVVAGVLAGSGSQWVVTNSGEWVQGSAVGIGGGLFLATLLMILFRRRYPRWWFDFHVELTRFSARISAYAGLLTDRYPSTTDEQSVHLDIDYPDAGRDLNRWLPLVKWLLALPHWIILGVLSVLAMFAVVIAWFAILFTGRYPRRLFDFVVGVSRWGLRAWAYSFLLVTDRYPPFRLGA
ncbi:MAG: DUF4389 domain-containing protein [Chloroflexi bacterium]|nr:DUF4389 domain-containing protein [Chloroflexota bacterium]